ncbi:peptide chain release factor 1 [uncultured Oscillibacter sp.]|uniref:peptide chain release factor 1 n=1 Tax=uncultured Oscillibacter sp. TaxID=876091 RepID=UPI0025E9A7E7|nr:peptide chain release factor 1 [uncultured Oscillibacter sp.]
MLEKLKEIALRYEDLQAQLGDGAIYGDSTRLAAVTRELKELEPVVEAYRAYTRARERHRQARELLHDPDFRELAQEELTASQEEERSLEERLRLLLLPRDPDDDRSVVLEVRGGVGGEEGALFAASLLRMYTMYAQTKGWHTDIVSMNETELGGVKECSVLVEGTGVYSRLKFESGVHRVQRVPETESGGRIHTSAATVAVLPTVEDVELDIDPKDLQIDTYRASGAGGQHVNKTESAIRITHLPTGLVVECQDERSQYKNKDKAMRVLRSRLYEMEREKQAAQTAAARKSQVGSGDRSERIRTYNFPQGRVTDHRIGLTLYKLDSVLDGGLDELIDALVTADQAEKMKNGARASDET